MLHLWRLVHGGGGEIQLPSMHDAAGADTCLTLLDFLQTSVSKTKQLGPGTTTRGTVRMFLVIRENCYLRHTDVTRQKEQQWWSAHTRAALTPKGMVRRPVCRGDPVQMSATIRHEGT